jgi:CBS domain containing-hemolysin-like protein
LANEPGHLLSTTQIGITVIGIVSGAFAAETVARQLAGLLGAITALQPYADTLALVHCISLSATAHRRMIHTARPSTRQRRLIDTG